MCKNLVRIGELDGRLHFDPVYRVDFGGDRRRVKVWFLVSGLHEWTTAGFMNSGLSSPTAKIIRRANESIAEIET